MTTLLDRAAYGALHRRPSGGRVSDRPRRGPRWTADRALGGAVALAGSVLVGTGLGRHPALLGDEGIYTNQAVTMLHGQLSPYTYDYDHPFFGWLQLAPMLGLVRWLDGGQPAVISGRVVMVAYSFATLALTYLLARRLDVRRCFAVVAVALLALSPLFLGEARLVLLDNLAVPWVLAAFVLALNPERRQWTYGMAGLCFAVGVLSKETVVLVAPALCHLVWRRAYPPIRQMSVAVFGTLAISGIAVYPLFAVLRGELLPGPDHVSLWTNGVMYQLASRSGSGALWQPGSARRVLLDQWLAADGRLVLAGTACAAAVIAVPRLRVIGLVVLLWSLPVLKPGGYLPQMYVIAVLPFLAIAIAAASDVLASAAVGGRRKVTRVLAPLCALLVLAALSVPGWHAVTRLTVGHGDEVATTVAAETWVRSNVSGQDNVLVDPSMWTDLVDAGFEHPWRGAIAYYQFDLDPRSSDRHLPQGWQDLDWVVETPEMAHNVVPLGLTRLAAALRHSTVVATIGHGAAAILVRRVDATRWNHGARP